MQLKRAISSAWPTKLTSWARWCAILAVAILLCLPFTSMACIDTALAQDAQASVQSDDEKAEKSEGSDAESDQKSDESEAIEDEETPMTSGLGGGEPVSNDIGFGGVIVVGIVAVSVFFLVLMRKLNGNIKDMDSMFK